MKKIQLRLLVLFFAITTVNGMAQKFSADLFKITEIKIDSSRKGMSITIFFAGKSRDFINYPYISSITDEKGDTLATGSMEYYGQGGNTSQTYGAWSVNSASFPIDFNGIVYFRYDTNDTVCKLAYHYPQRKKIKSRRMHF